MVQQYLHLSFPVCFSEPVSKRVAAAQGAGQAVDYRSEEWRAGVAVQVVAKGELYRASGHVAGCGCGYQYLRAVEEAVYNTNRQPACEDVIS